MLSLSLFIPLFHPFSFVVQKTGISTVSVHGDKTQNERTAVLQAFINGDHPIIVSTAVLGRGLDLLRVDMVRL